MTRTGETIPGAQPALVAIIVFGLAARCRQYTGNPSYWYDEAYLLLNWMLSARHQYYPILQDQWRQHFLDVSSASSLLGSLARCLIKVGDYGTTGMGVPLVLCAALGIAVLWKRSPSLAVLLVGPIAFAALAAAVRRYPLGDRLAFFVLPNLWLASAAGIGAIVDRLNKRVAWAGMVVAAALLLPDAARTAKDLIVVQPKADFRTAFSYVRAHWEVGDRLWVSHPEVYQVYFGEDATILGAYTPADIVAHVARTGRLWMVYTPQAPGVTNFPETFRRVQAVAGQPSQRHNVSGLEIALYGVSRGAPR